MFFGNNLGRSLAFLFTFAFLLLPVAALASDHNSDLSAPAGFLSPIEKTDSLAIPSSAQKEIETAETGSTEIQARPAPDSGVVPPLGTYIKNFLPDIVGGTEDIFSSRNLAVALIGGTLTAAAVSIDHLDKNAKSYFQTRRPLNGVSAYGSEIGLGQYHVAVGAALLGIGELSNDKKLADTGAVTLEALLVNGIATETLKYAFDRRRPGGGKFSFPSGHSSSTATLAASISAMYDWDLRVTIPLYSVALFVGASRMQDNEHYLSDVIGGLTLGTIVGSSFAHYHNEKENQAAGLRNLSVAPVVDKDIKGAVFSFKW